MSKAEKLRAICDEAWSQPHYRHDLTLDERMPLELAEKLAASVLGDNPMFSSCSKCKFYKYHGDYVGGICDHQATRGAAVRAHNRDVERPGWCPLNRQPPPTSKRETQ